MSIKINLFFILIITLIAFVASSPVPSNINIERNDINNKNDNNNSNDKNEMNDRNKNNKNDMNDRNKNNKNDMNDRNKNNKNDMNDRNRNNKNDNNRNNRNDRNNNNNNNNVCKNSKLDKGDGTQNPDGYCVETVIGEIPSVDNMISTLIVQPADGSTLKAKKGFRIETISDNLITGFFSDPVKEYYVKSQKLKDGKILGHSHIVIQKMDRNRRKPLNPKVFTFFKGLDQPAKNGVLSVDLKKGLPAGDYRICTVVSSFSHQPVVMPVAQRGPQDDCVRIKVRD